MVKNKTVFRNIEKKSCGEWFPWDSSIPAMPQQTRQKWLSLLICTQIIDKSVIIHDETTLQANKDQLISSLGSKGYKRDASKEREIMISEEKSGLEVIKKKTLLEISPIICI